MTRKFWKGIIIGLLLIFGQNTFAATTELGLGDTFKYSLISAGDILKVPEGATGCTIHDDSIRGTLDLDEQVGSDTLDATEVTNGTFPANIVGWTNNVTFPYDTFEWGGAGVIHLVSDGTHFSYAYSDDNISVTAGELYKVTYDYAVASGTITALRLRQGFGGGTAYSQNDNVVGTDSYTGYFTAGLTEDLAFIIYAADGVDVNCTLDNISVQEVTSTTGIYNTWITDIDLAGLAADEPVLFFNCAFEDTKAAIELLNAVDVLYFDDECQFSIVTADCFRDYAGADYHLTAGSPLKDAGEDTGADVDLEGRVTPIGAGYDIGAYELRLSGGSMSMGMGLQGYCPHRVDD